MSGQPADSGASSPGLTGDQIQALISTEEPVWRPEAETKTDAADEEIQTEGDGEGEGDQSPTIEESKSAVAPVEAAPAEEKQEEKEEGKPEEDPRIAAMAAQLELQREHNARMSGKIGLLTDQLRKAASDRPDASEAVDEDRASRIERRLDESEAARTSDAVRSAIQNTVAVFNERPEVKALLPEVMKVSSRYNDDLEAALSESDPARATRLMELTLKAILADAKAEKNAEARKAAETVRDASRSRVAAAKKNAAPTGRTSQATESAVPEPSAGSDDDEIAAYYRKRGRPGW